jgi:hypothetical protein
MLQAECKSCASSWQHRSGQRAAAANGERAALHLFAADDAHGAGPLERIERGELAQPAVSTNDSLGHVVVQGSLGRCISVGLPTSGTVHKTIHPPPVSTRPFRSRTLNQLMTPT